jgi:transposase InsO family protein
MSEGIHDRDAIFSAAVDSALKDFGIRALRTPVRTPTANAFCERVIGTIRRECLDFIIPINERHLRSTVREFVAYLSGVNYFFGLTTTISPAGAGVLIVAEHLLQSRPSPRVLGTRDSGADPGQRSGCGP